MTDKDKVQQLIDAFSSLSAEDMVKIKDLIDEMDTEKENTKKDPANSTPPSESKAETEEAAGKTMDAAMGTQTPQASNQSASTGDTAMPPMPNKRKKWWKVPVAAAACAGIFFAGGTFVKNTVGNRFAAGTYINGYDVSRMSVTEAKSIVTAKAQNGILTVRWADGKEEYIALSALDCDYETSPALDTLLPSQDFISEIKGLFASDNLQRYEVTVTATPKDALLLMAVSELDCVRGVGTVKSLDASIAVKDGKYTIVDEVPGTLMDGNKVFAAAKEVLENGEETLDLSASSCYAPADVRSDDATLASIIEDANGYEDMVIDLDLNGVSERIDWSRIASWLSMDEDNHFTVDKGSVSTYVAQLADRYNTLGKTRSFVTVAGDTITVGAGELDCYGFQMDEEVTTDAIYDMVVNKTSGEVAATWIQEGVSHGLLNDFGDTYIVVSIADQHMWFIDRGQLAIETDVVTGLDNAERHTPTGVYMLLAKYKDYNMSGSYGSAYCNYCIAISHEGICIHDSSWRSSYGGSIYKTDGSHGCINTPLNIMQQIYDGNTMYNMPIIIY